jgi:beta-glucosidase
MLRSGSLSLCCALAATPAADVEGRIDQPLARMTLEEKIARCRRARLWAARFRKAAVRLKPSEKRSVAFALGTADLAFHNTHMQLVTEPGTFEVWIAPDSDRGLRGEFKVGE